MPLRSRLESYFEFERARRHLATEILAGFTTFMTMAYIVFVNPAILHETGMPLAAVTAATCLSAAVGQLSDGRLRAVPYRAGAGHGAQRLFHLHRGEGHGRGVAGGAGRGLHFRRGVLAADRCWACGSSSSPPSRTSCMRRWRRAWGCSSRCIGFRNSGIIVANPATTVALGNLRDKSTALALFGLLLMAALLAWRVRAAMLIGILATTALGLAHRRGAEWTPQAYRFSDLSATAFKLDLGATRRLGFLEIVFVFLFIDLFDNIGTLVAVGKRAGLFDKAHQIPRVNRILLSDATATIVGSLAGTSTVVSYIESAAGVAAGGRTGVTAIVTGLLFVAALFVAPVVGAIPAAATAPALIVVGSLMISAVAEIAWNDPEIAVPAFLTIMTIPLTFSIANGLAFGFTAFTLLKVARGKFRQVNWFVYVLTALFIARFVYLSRG